MEIPSIISGHLFTTTLYPYYEMNCLYHIFTPTHCPAQHFLLLLPGGLFLGRILEQSFKDFSDNPEKFGPVP
jgi:hypothetical protein